MPDPMSDPYSQANLTRWNELVGINAASKSYDLEGFRRGRLSLLPIELEEMGDVKGKRLLHLQCHFGLDTLSWARLGAEVTGVDYSGEAIRLARSLRDEISIPAEFIHSDIYSLEEKLDERFDVVYTSYGVLCWLRDLGEWGRIISRFLRAGGFFYIVENHPLGAVIDGERSPFRVGHPYFSEGPTRFEIPEAYADSEARVENATCYQWFHPMEEIINSLISAGLVIEFLHEFPFSFFRIHPDMREGEDGYWHFTEEGISVPMIFSLRAKKANEIGNELAARYPQYRHENAP